MATSNSDTQTRLSWAKTQLILKHPFVGAIAMSMPFELDDQFPTAATNGKWVAFNPDYVKSLSNDELLFLVAHECLHPMLEHHLRRGERDREGWNVAADYVINRLLNLDGIGRMPKNGLDAPEIYSRGGGTSEGIYALLDGKLGSKKGKPLDQCEDGEGETPAEMARQRAEWQVKVAQAAHAAKAAGKLSANMERVVNEILRPKVGWREVLQRFLVKAKAGSRTFARPNRRFVSQGLYLPSKDGEVMGEIVVAVDCSSSINDEMLAQFAAELRSIKDDLLPSAVHVVYFDSSVLRTETYQYDDDLNLRFVGGGGTDFAPVFEHIATQDWQPVAIVFLTDLECSSFGTAPDASVLWVSTYGTEAPFGEVVKMEV